MRYEFRGKDIKTGEWVYGYLSYSEQQDRYYIGVTELLTPVDPETVGQFTGLLDKESNKVFEGDIVKSDCLDYNTEIKWLHSSYGFVNEYKNPQSEFYFNIHTFKKLGNINDNPELLQ